MSGELLNADEAADYLGVRPVTVYRWCREGRLPCLKVGKLWRLRRAALEEFLRRNEERASALGPQLLAFLDALPHHVAIVDPSGTIVAVNGAWRRFAIENGGLLSEVSEGINYLEICDSAGGDQDRYASGFAAGLRSVLAGGATSFDLEYPCHSPEERRWFVGRAVAFDTGAVRLAAVFHEDVTRLGSREAGTASAEADA